LAEPSEPPCVDNVLISESQLRQSATASDLAVGA
jgi:hypothetical protein